MSAEKGRLKHLVGALLAIPVVGLAYFTLTSDARSAIRGTLAESLFVFAGVAIAAYWIGYGLTCFGTSLLFSHRHAGEQELASGTDEEDDFDVAKNQAKERRFAHIVAVTLTLPVLCLATSLAIRGEPSFISGLSLIVEKVVIAYGIGWGLTRLGLRFSAGRTGEQLPASRTHADESYDSDGVHLARERTKGRRSNRVMTVPAVAEQVRAGDAEVPPFLLDPVVIPRDGEGIRRLAHGVGALLGVVWLLFVFSRGGDGIDWLFVRFMGGDLLYDHHVAGPSVSDFRVGCVLLGVSLALAYGAGWGLVRGGAWVRDGFSPSPADANKYAGAGVHRLAFFLSGVAAFIGLLLGFSDDRHPRWLEFGIGLAVLAAGAWSLVRGVAWVLDGFARDKMT